jgi:hypothetical protein
MSLLLLIIGNITLLFILKNIATNKIHAISERLEIKDMFDMYFIFTKEKFDLDNLLNKVENKF